MLKIPGNTKKLEKVRINGRSRVALPTKMYNFYSFYKILKLSIEPAFTDRHLGV